MNNNSDLNDNRTDSRSEGREMDDVTRNQLNEKQKIVDEFLARKEAEKQERIEQEKNKEIIPDDGFSDGDADEIPPDVKSSVGENPPREEFFSFDDDVDEIPPQDGKSSVGENPTGEGVFSDDDVDEIPPQDGKSPENPTGEGAFSDDDVDRISPDASGTEDQNENKGYAFKDNAINALKATIMIPGLWHGISNATLSQSQIPTNETDRAEQVITVREEDLPKSPLEEFSSEFKKMNGISLFDAASEIAQDDMKRWKTSVDMKETLSVRDDEFSDKNELDSDHLDSPNETSGLI